MKVRNGFVSNSSSSSFIVIVKEEDHLKALGDLKTKPEKTFIENVMSTKEKKFGTNYRYYFGIENDEGSSLVNIYISEDKERDYKVWSNLKERKLKYWDNYIEKLNELNIDYFYISTYS